MHLQRPDTLRRHTCEVTDHPRVKVPSAAPELARVAVAVEDFFTDTLTLSHLAASLRGHGGQGCALHSVTPQSCSELQPGFTGALGHESVAAEMEGVSQPLGSPINAATNSGLRTIPLLPPVEVVGSRGKAVACDFNVGEPAFSLVRIGSDPLAASDALGVPHILSAWSTSDSPNPRSNLRASIVAGRRPLVASGEAHIFACTVSDVAVLRSMRAFIAMCASGDF